MVHPNGYVYIDADVHQKYFAGVDAVIMLAREGKVWIMPVYNNASGGLLMKVRYRRGDRAVAAMDFLRQDRLEDGHERICPVSWDSGAAGLAIELNA